MEGKVTASRISHIQTLLETVRDAFHFWWIGNEFHELARIAASFREIRCDLPSGSSPFPNFETHPNANFDEQPLCEERKR